jgi:hypothetical protein
LRPIGNARVERPLPKDPDDPLVQVDIVQGHAGALGPAHPGVHQ